MLLPRALAVCRGSLAPKTGSEGSRGLRFREKGECEALAIVVVQEGESLESALRRFKRKVRQQEIIKDAKSRSYYLKPGEKRRVRQLP